MRYWVLLSLLLVGCVVVPIVEPPLTYTPTRTPEPTATLEPTPEPSQYTQAEREMLSRLCVAEARGLGEQRENGCLAVISTVMRRITDGYLSDGTIEGTLAWNDGETWQFPPYVIYGCENIAAPQACLDNEPLDWALEVVRRYENGMRSTCNNYLFYNSIIGGDMDCRIDGNSQFIEFHNGHSFLTPTPSFMEPYERCGEFGVDVREAEFLAQAATTRNVRSGPNLAYSIVDKMLPEEIYLVLKHDYVDDNTRWSCVYNIEEVEVVGWVADIYNGEVVVNIYGSK